MGEEEESEEQIEGEVEGEGEDGGEGAVEGGGGQWRRSRWRVEGREAAASSGPALALGAGATGTGGRRCRQQSYKGTAGTTGLARGRGRIRSVERGAVGPWQ